MVVNPSTVLVEQLEEMGMMPGSLWRVPGEPFSNVAWIEGILIKGLTAVVITFRDGEWDVYTASFQTGEDEIIQDAIERCSISEDF